VADKVVRGAAFNPREITPGLSSVNALERLPDSKLPDRPEPPKPNYVKPDERRAVVPAQFCVMICKNCGKYPLDHFEVVLFPFMKEGWCSLKCWQACLARKCCG
jgi:hypothetical protein